MQKTLFKEAALVEPDRILKGDLLVEDDTIRSIAGKEGVEGTQDAKVIECDGDYLLPGIIELHTDNLEKNMMPRPKVAWPDCLTAVFAHDAQIVSAGITTVFDALSVGEYHDKGRVAMLGKAVAAQIEARKTGLLRSEHYLHLRCELADRRMQKLFSEVCDAPFLRLISLMDHTPGQRQWRDLDSYRTYYSEYKTWNDTEFKQSVKELQATRDSCADSNAAFAVAFARSHKLPMASHDDTLVAHVDEALKYGAAISEFPTTLAAAKHAAGKMVWS